MEARWRHLLDLLGADGLRAAIAESLDRAHLVELASAAGLRFPGRRAGSVDDAALRESILKGFLDDEHVRGLAVKALQRANEQLLSTVREVPAGDLAAWARRCAPGMAGRARLALAVDDRPEAASAREALPSPAAASPEAANAPAHRGAASAPTPSGSEAAADPIARLKSRIDSLEDARASQAATIAELRRRQESIEHDLVAARKEALHLRRDLASVEAERDRLREERQRQEGQAAQDLPRRSDARLEEIATALHHLERGQKKIAHDLEEAHRAKGSGEAPGRPWLDALAASVEAARHELGELRRHVEDESHRSTRAIQELTAETHRIRSDVSQWRKATTPPAARRRGEPERVGVFVDVQNMYYAARQLNARLDFGALMTAATSGRRLIRAIAYVVQNRDIDQSGFLAMLQQKNYEVRRKDLKIRTDGSSKGDWDMEMALDILGLAVSLDVVVLVSGDGDFSSLVTQIKTVGPKVEVYSFPGSTAKELVEAADRHVPLDEGFLLRGAQPLKTS